MIRGGCLELRGVLHLRGVLDDEMMTAMKLASVDANLFVVLHALLQERSVARAARRLALSPSATSHALARARELMGDPLLVRGGRGLALTPRAEGLRDAIGKLISDMDRILEGPGAFEPSRLSRSFRVAMSDHARFVLLRPADKILHEEAPAVDVFSVPFGAHVLRDVADGMADYCLGVFEALPEGVIGAPLFTDRLVTIARTGHPAVSGVLDPEAFAALPHLLVSPGGVTSGLVDPILTKHGVERRVARTLPTFLDAPFFIAQSDYVTSLPYALAVPFLSLLDLQIVKLSFPLPEFSVSLNWHVRNEADPAHLWFRGVLRRAAATMPQVHPDGRVQSQVRRQRDQGPRPAR